MAITTDTVALNQWIPIAYAGQLPSGAWQDTLVLGQAVRIGQGQDGSYTCHELTDAGGVGRELPVVKRFELYFTTLGPAPRPLPDIGEFAERDRKVVNCGSVGVNTSPFRIVENFLDMAHFCFVHTDLLGSPEKTEVFAYKAEHRRDVDEIWAVDCSFFQPAASKAAAALGEGQVSHYTYRIMSPFSVMLYKSAIGQPGRSDAIAVFVQPKTETRCVAYMTMAILDDESTMSELIDFQQTIFLQDRIILENQRPALLSLAPKAEIPTRADLSSIAYRRWLKAAGIRFGTLQEVA